MSRRSELSSSCLVCPFSPTGYHVAAATVGARVGQLERSREFLRRAAEGYAAVGQLLNVRGARETLKGCTRRASAPRKV